MFDVAVIGAGIVGCAISNKFSKYLKCVIIEKEYPLSGASASNSSLLHCGFDAKPGSMEQQLVSTSYKKLTGGLLDELSVSYSLCGAIVCIYDEVDIEKLSELKDKAHMNGVETKILPHGSDELPSNAIMGLYVKEEGIINGWELGIQLLRQAEMRGCKIMCKTEVIGGHFDDGKWHLTTTDGLIQSKYVINTSGLYGDITDKMLLSKCEYTIKPRKGQFVVLQGEDYPGLTHIIMPLPTGKTKGVLIWKSIFGLVIGPTAEEQKDRNEIVLEQKTKEELLEKGNVAWPRTNGRTIVVGMYGGLRPATEYNDYQISHIKDINYIYVSGIRSTGLSASVGIASYVWKSLRSVGFPSAVDNDVTYRFPITHKLNLLASKL